MEEDAKKDVTFSTLWYIIVLIVFAFGTLVNFVLMVILIRFRKSTEGLVTSGIVQTVIDWLLCLVYILHASMSSFDADIPTVAMILCHALFSNAILWGLVAVRMNMSMLTAFYYFIQFVFPFMRIERHQRTMALCIGLLLPLCGLLGSLPHAFALKYDAHLNRCVREVGKDFLAPSRAMITLRLFILVGFLYNFLIPMVTGMYLYYHALRVLRVRDKSKHAVAYREMRLTATLDTWLQAGFSVIAICQMFLQKYPNADSLDSSVTFELVGTFFLCVYSIVYPCVSVVLRRRYHKPILDCLIQLGMHPTESWLAQRWNIAEHTERNRYMSTDHSVRARKR